MTTTVQIDGVGNVQMDDSFKSLSPSDQQATVDEIANQHGGQSAPSAPPNMASQFLGSPIGRTIHDVVQAPIDAVINHFGNQITPQNPADAQAHPITTAIGKSLLGFAAGNEDAYNRALAANRTTPGYAAAQQTAQATQARLNAPGQGQTAVPNIRSGFTDAVTAPLNPAMAGLGGLVTGGLDQMNANADAQSASQNSYAQQHPVLSTGANILGGLMASPVKGPLPAPAPTPFAPTIDDLRAASKAAYKQVDDAGVTVSNDAMNHMADSLEDKLGDRLDPTLHPDATAAFNRVLQYGTDGSKGTQAASFTDLDNLRRVVADAAGSPKAADRAMARQVLDHVDDFVGGLSPSDLDTSQLDAARQNLISATGNKGQIASQIKGIETNNPGALVARGAAGADTRAGYVDLVNNQLPAAEQARQAAMGDFGTQKSLIDQGPQGVIDALNSARDNWSRASQASLIQQQIDKAGIKASANYSQSGIENSLRQQFKSLALNDRAMSRLAPPVQQAVKDVAAGSPVGNVLRSIGKYAPHGPVATAAGMGTGYMLGGIEGGGVGALALPMVGEAARAGATAMTKQAAQKALNAALMGRGLPRLAPQAAIQMPAITSASRLPLGLISSLPQLQNQ